MVIDLALGAGHLSPIFLEKIVEELFVCYDSRLFCGDLEFG